MSECVVRRKVKKVVAVCFLEALKLTIDQLGQHRLQLEQRRAEDTGFVTAQYRDVRRLRDYLQRTVGLFQDLVELDLSRADQDLLVACCLRYMETIELRPQGQDGKAIDREWLQRKFELLGDQIVELAEEPLQQLSLPRPHTGLSDAAREVHKRISQKFSKLVRGRRGIGADVDAVPEEGAQAGGVPGFGHVFGSDPTAAIPAETTVGSIGPAFAGMGHDDSERLPPQTSRGAALIDSRTMRDPRLRSLLTLDLRAFDRAVDAGDHRLAVVHLASILEAAVLDHALLRRSELGVSGPPESWNAEEILLRLFGDACPPRERSLAYQLFSARNLIRPATQLATPTVVTPGSLDRLVEFVTRAMRQMGYAARTGTVARPAVGAAPFVGLGSRSG